MSIVTALSAIRATVAAVSGIRQTPTNPTETANVWPFAIVYALDGNASAFPIGTSTHLLNIAVEVFTARKDLARDFDVINPFLDSIPAALLAEVTGTGSQFESNITTFDTINYELLEKDYAGVAVIGYRFTLTNVKIIT